MHELTQLIAEDMRPALGVTEPGAIAFAVAVAREHLSEPPIEIFLRLNSGMLKNAFTCGIPGTNQVGAAYAAALGAVAASSAKGLECLDGLEEKDCAEAELLIQQGKVRIELSEVTSRIYIEALVKGQHNQAQVIIQDSHTNITRISLNGKILFEKESSISEEAEQIPLIHRYNLRSLYDYAVGVPAEELLFIQEAYDTNMALFMEGINNSRTSFSHFLLQENGNKIFSQDFRRTARLLCGAAIEARVIGLNRPAMSITGSGAHGIIATMPLLAASQVCGCSQEQLLRATALSYLICMFIKEYSGKLSAFCGCAIAAGTGAACGLVMLKGGGVPQMEAAIRNMSSSITGMICDGGNQGCTMKGLTAVDAALCAVDLSMQNISVDAVHGINGSTPESTMRYMGYIASPGMTGTEKAILDILLEKSGPV